MDLLIQAIANVTPLEWAANLTTVVCIYLAGRNSVHTWWTGIVACVLFGFLFFEYKLYADVALQLFFIITGAYGWYYWSETKNKPALPISNHIDTSKAVMLWFAGVAVWIGYSAILMYFTDASMPAADTAVLVLSVVAQLLMMRRHIANWYVWIAVNSVATPLFFYKELYLTAAFYAVYFFHAIYAAFVWHKQLRIQNAK